MFESEPSDGKITEITRPVSETCGDGKFVPRVVYDEALDTVQVFVDEPSPRKVVITTTFSVVERNIREYHKQDYVGFNIEGARAFCRAYGLPYTGSVSTRQILEALANAEPKSLPTILDLAIPMLEDHNLDLVEFPA